MIDVERGKISSVRELKARWSESPNRSVGNKSAICRPSSIIFRPSWTTRLIPKAQVMIEFTFCMIILFLMMYGAIMVFRWVGLDLGQRQQAHQAVLEQGIDLQYGQCAAEDPITGICTDYRNVTRGPLTQIDPFFYQPGAMNAVWAGD